ncbi:MAG: hypothetical protein MUO21_09715, partial [Nitrososphaeraceae archaeon]|nr:hypothetical protein [Nitrososphaeraceae archaeon]
MGKIGNGDCVVVLKTSDENIFIKYSGKDMSAIAELIAVQLKNPTIFLDWGGVFGLSGDGSPLAKFEGDYWLFSFTTPKKIGSELESMTNKFFGAGGAGLIILTQKKGKQGKAALMNALVPQLKHKASYYED